MDLSPLNFLNFENMIDVKKLTYSIQNTLLLNELTFSIPSSGIFHIQAGNGAGKTTLLQLLCGLKQPDNGDIFFKNQSIYQNLREYQQSIIYIGHQIPLQNQLSISENWLLSGVDNEAYTRSIDFFELRQCQHFLAQQLSAGQLKKAVLMNLIIQKRPIWILDEPTVGLDVRSVDKFWNLVETHVAHQGLVVLTSHQSLPALQCETKSIQL